MILTNNNIKLLLISSYSCLYMIYKSLILLDIIPRIGFIVMPIISSLMNIHINSLLTKSDVDIIMCLIYKLIYDYINMIFVYKVTYRQSNIMNQTDHYFDVGISYRVTTAYNNNISPTLNVCFLNGAIAY